MCKLGLEKAEESEIKLSNSWIIEKAREFQKNIYLCFIGYIKVFDYVDHNKLCKTLNEMGIPYHLTCLLRNLSVKKQQLESCMEQLTVSGRGKE